MKKVHIIAVVFYLAAPVFFISSATYAEEIKFHISLDRNIMYLGQSAKLNLQFEGSSRIPAPDIPEIDGFQVRYAGPSTRMSIVNGRMLSSVTHIYRLAPLKTGKFQIGPFSFEHKGDTYTSNMISAEVLDSAAHGTDRAREQDKQEVNLSDRVFVKMHIEKTGAYINEIIPLTIKLYVNGISIRDIQYPEYYHEGFSNGQFDKPRQYKEARREVLYDVVEFKTILFATREGKHTLGPARIKANLVTQKKRRRSSSSFDDFFGRDPFDGFFGNYEAHPIELKSEEMSLNVLPLPVEGRPGDFRGAVGNFNFSLSVSPAEVTAGDPVTLTMMISGEGNFNSVNSPELTQHDGFKTYEPQATQEENRKMFEQIVIPTTNAVKKIPAISFSFFNTDKEQYQTILRGDMPLIVRKPEKTEEITIIEGPRFAERALIKETFGRDIIYIKEPPGKLREKGRYFYNNPLFLLFQIVPVLALFFVWTIKKRKEKLTTDIGYARRLLAPRKAKKGMREAEHLLEKNRSGEFYDAVFRTVREYVGNRYHVPSGGITSEVVDDVLTEKGVDQDIVSRLKNVFKECDMARYAPSELGKANMQDTLKELKEIIDYLERYKG